MFFIAILFFFLIYLAISIGVVVVAVKWAKRYGRRPWVWGSLAAFVMYNLVFWDWIPTLVAHKYYCGKEAEFTVNKTLEQWKQENPGVVETLVLPKDRTPQVQWVGNGYTEVHPLNQRFDWIINNHSVTFLLPIAKRKEEITDTNTGEVLARHVDFSSGNQSRPFRGIKFWLVRESCNTDQANRIQISKLIDDLYALTKGAKK